jgi:hypothetical protein
MEPGLRAFTRMRRLFKSVVHVRANERTAALTESKRAQVEMLEGTRGEPFRLCSLRREREVWLNS